MDKSRILIIEDDEDIGLQLKGYLQEEGFEADISTNGIEARERLRHNRYDVLVVDIMMPYEDGFTFIERLREAGRKVAFVFVTARAMKEDVIKGLMLGADDYIRKPFDPDELVLRIKNLVARTGSTAAEESRDSVIEIGDYLFDRDNLSLTSPAGRKSLTEKEAKVLEYLCRNEGKVIRREEILEHAWSGADFFTGRSMDVFMTRLRRHFSGDDRIQIESVRGVGFRFFRNHREI